MSENEIESSLGHHLKCTMSRALEYAIAISYDCHCCSIVVVKNHPYFHDNQQPLWKIIDIVPDGIQNLKYSKRRSFTLLEILSPLCIKMKRNKKLTES